MKKRIVILTQDPKGFGDFQQELMHCGFDVLAGPLTIAQSVSGDTPFIENFDLILMDQKAKELMNKPVKSALKKAAKPLLYISIEDEGQIFLSHQLPSTKLCQQIQGLLQNESKEEEKERVLFEQLEELAIQSQTLDEDDCSFHFELTNSNLIIDGFPIQLSPKEMSLLEFLSTTTERLVTNSELYEQVWKKEYKPNRQPFLSNLILRIRKKVEQEYGVTDSFILNRKGKGYQISQKFVQKSEI